MATRAMATPRPTRKLAPLRTSQPRRRLFQQNRSDPEVSGQASDVGSRRSTRRRRTGIEGPRPATVRLIEHRSVERCEALLDKPGDILPDQRPYFVSVAAQPERGQLGDRGRLDAMLVDEHGCD